MTKVSSTNDNWMELTFSEAVQVNPSVELKRGEIYPFVDMASVDGGQRTVNGIVEREFKGNGSKFQNGDTLMARITPCLENGKIAQYKRLGDQQRAHGSTEFIVIRGRSDTTTDEFAYYLTRWEEVRQYAIGQMTGTSGRQRVPVDSLNHLTIPLPPLPEQRAIAHILGTLDDKIELNRQINQTLEEMAHAIYKDWFVDFGPTRAKLEGREPYLPPDLWDLFPNELVDSELGEIPEGWEVGELRRIATFPVRTVKPQELSSETVYIGLEHMPRKSVALNDWETAEKVTSGKLSFHKGEFLFGKLRPYFHKVGMASTDGICSTDIVVVAPRDTLWSSFVLLCISTEEFVSYTDQTSNGTRMPRTNWKTMGQYKICIPPKPVAREFQNITQNSLNRTAANIGESRLLSRQRDALLPHLLSGEVMDLGWETSHAL